MQTLEEVFLLLCKKQDVQSANTMAVSVVRVLVVNLASTANTYDQVYLYTSIIILSRTHPPPEWHWGEFGSVRLWS